MKSSSLSFCFLLGFPFFLSGQQLNGRVVHEAAGVPGVHVINRTAARATITDASGAFSILAREGDTLYFSSLHLERKTLVADAGTIRDGFLYLDLQEAVQQLDEVVLRPHDLSGNLSADMRGLLSERVTTSSSLGLPNAGKRNFTQSERLLIEATSGGGIPLNPILNGISGRTRKLKQRLARDRRYSRSRAVRHTLGDSLFVRDLGIPVDRIEDFMYYCEVDENFQSRLALGDLLNVLSLMRDKSKTYREANQL